jgi:hypothetical protein
MNAVCLVSRLLSISDWDQSPDQFFHQRHGEILAVVEILRPLYMEHVTTPAKLVVPSLDKGARNFRRSSASWDA